MFYKGLNKQLMNEAAAADAAAGGGGGGDPAAAAHAGGGEGGSALSAATPEWSFDKIPEKYRVMGADDQPDHIGTLRKVHEAHSSMEKRMGEFGMRPATADEYKLPESDFFKNVQLDPEATKGFREEFHKAGGTQALYDLVMNKYGELAPGLVEGGEKATMESTVATLQQQFGDNYQTEMTSALTAAETIAGKLGIDMADVHKEIGNSPIAIRLLAAIGHEMREDSTPAASTTSSATDSSIQQLMASEAYQNPRHPEHAAVTAKVNAYYDKRVPN